MIKTHVPIGHRAWKFCSILKTQKNLLENWDFPKSGYHTIVNLFVEDSCLLLNNVLSIAFTRVGWWWCSRHTWSNWRNALAVWLHETQICIIDETSLESGEHKESFKASGVFNDTGAAKSYQITLLVVFICLTPANCLINASLGVYTQYKQAASLYCLITLR